MTDSDEVLFFTTLDDLRDWIARRPADLAEAWLGFHRIRYGTDPNATVRYQPAADELASAGWVGTARRSVDANRFAVRFAPGEVPRRRAPAWQDHPSGMPELDREHEERFRADAAAWAFFEKQTPKYRRVAIWWVMGAKAEETKERRFDQLVASCAAGERLAQLQRQM